MKGMLRAGLSASLLAALVACSSAGNSADNSATSPAATEAVAAASPAAQNGASASDGGAIYATNCSSCHQTNGKGVPGAFPPLAMNPAVTGDPATVIAFVKDGLNGKIAVAGQTYNGTMPKWGQNLTDAQIASVVTYIRASWGNTAGAVTTADVSAVK